MIRVWFGAVGDDADRGIVLKEEGGTEEKGLGKIEDDTAGEMERERSNEEVGQSLEYTG